MLESVVLLNVLEYGFNRLVNMDPDAGVYLQPLAGKVIAIRISQLDWTIYCCPHESGIQLLDRYHGDPDTVMTGSPSAFVLMGLSDSPLSLLTSRDVIIEGDVETGRKFQALFDRLDLDPEDWLSRYTGDVVAHQIGNFLKAGRNWTHDFVKTLELDFTEFFQQERRDLPTQHEAETFFGEVDNLRADEDRLEARIQRLRASLN